MDNLTSWKSKYSQIFGALRGGAQPIQVGDRFLNVVHSRYSMPGGVEYVPAVYEFSATYPFAPVSELPHPIDLGFDPHSDPGAHGFPDSRATDLNPTTSWVVYPTGFAFTGDKFVISGGFNDSHCFVATGNLSHLEGGMSPVKATLQPKIKPVGSVEISTIKGFEAQAISPKLPLFWWQAFDHVMSPGIHNGRFQSGNFGDEASEQLVAKLTGAKPRPNLPGERKLLAIGSVYTEQTVEILFGAQG